MNPHVSRASLSCYFSSLDLVVTLRLDFFSYVDGEPEICPKLPSKTNKDILYIGVYVFFQLELKLLLIFVILTLYFYFIFFIFFNYLIHAHE